MESNLEGGAVKTRLSKRAIVVAGLLVLGLFLVRPQVGRVRWRVVGAISQALGRRVEIGSVHLRFLPQPGFELDDFVIHDDRSFGAEPLLRSPEVTAGLRVAALLHGRIEITSLSLSEASLNLTRSQQNRWNLEDLLQRAASTTTAPTASGNSPSRPQFPYIEATQARINFKIGAEKTHFALTNADFALWQDSENTWSMRLKAQPIRTDASLTDTGRINISGKWQRSAVLHETPVQFSFEWKQAQIGQVSKLIYGSDQGWRGNAVLSGTLLGNPGRLKITTDAAVDDFRRHDVAAPGDLRLTAHCSAEYGSIQNTLSDLDCSAPVGDGSLELKGSASGWALSAYSLSLVASKLPVQNVLSAARQVAQSVPSDLSASGTLNGRLVVRRIDAGQPAEWSGDGELQELGLNSGITSAVILVSRVPLTLANDQQTLKQGDRTPQETLRLEVGPFNVPMGGPGLLKAHALVSLAGYEASVRGDASIKRLLQAARTMGLPAPAVNADGISTVDLSIAKAWSAQQTPQVTGTAQLRSIRAQVRGVNGPLQITSASLVLDDNFVRVQNLNAFLAEAVWRGWLLVPRPCGVPGDCRLQFSLHTPEVTAVALNNLLNPTARKRSWFRFLSSHEKQEAYLLQSRAKGKILVDKLHFATSVCNHVSADATLDAGKLTLANVNTELLGGKARGDWDADFSTKPPSYSGTGAFDSVSLSETASLMNDPWISGTGSVKYHFKAAGWTFEDLMDSAEVSADFAIENGDFPHVVLTNTSGPLHARAFAGSIALQKGVFSFEDTKLESAAGVYRISGTASLTGALNLKMSGESAIGYGLSGTVARTRVSQIRAITAQAALKQ
jgi:AsmA-like C-terminal region/AsmA family